MNGQIETGQAAPDAPKRLAVKVPRAANMNLATPRAGKSGIVTAAGSSGVELSFDAIFIGQRLQFGIEIAPSRERGI